MVNYNNSKIYKIVSNQTDDIYYGSTTQPLCKRMVSHRCNLKRYNSGLLKEFTASFDIMKFEDAKIILVENVKCNNKEELLMKERKYIENNKCCNKISPIRTKEEKHKYMKQYDENRKESQKEYHKNYYQENIDKMHEYDENRKEKRSIEGKQNRIKCIECNKELRKDSMKRHFKMKHQI